MAKFRRIWSHWMVLNDTIVTFLLCMYMCKPQKIFVSAWIRVARFFLLQYSKTGESIPNYPRQYTKLPEAIYQMAIKYTNIFHSETLQNLPKFRFLVWN
jgi:hypothetical protein